MSPQARVLAFSVPEPNSGCWLWLGSLDRGGYGRVSSKGWRGCRNRLAHRLAYEAFISPIPDELTLDHRCRVRSCVNPAHLRPVTRGENTLATNSENLAAV